LERDIPLHVDFGLVDLAEIQLADHNVPIDAGVMEREAPELSMKNAQH
jgi:hypothetical protein